MVAPTAGVNNKNKLFSLGHCLSLSEGFNKYCSLLFMYNDYIIHVAPNTGIAI